MGSYMLKMFKNQKLYKIFISDIKNYNYGLNEAREKLKELPIEGLRKIGKTIIFSNYDGCNYASKLSELSYFENLDRWQKENYINQRLYVLCK